MINKLSTPEEVANEFAQYFVRSANAIINNEGLNFYVALSGGNTPKIFFRVLAEKYKQEVDWSRVHFFWGDERMVPHTDAESNFGEAKATLFDKISIPSANIHPVKGDAQPKDEAKRYSKEIMRFLPDEGGLPRFDLIILGMGSDGHTASIFPNQIELINSTNVCEVAVHPDTGQKRITLTGSVINTARRVVFLVTGENKSDKVNEIFNHTGQFMDFPAAHISPETGKLIWYLDEEAGKEINN